MMILTWLLVGSLLSVAQRPAPAPAPGQQAPALNPNDLPVSIDRIQRALQQPPAIQLKERRPIFRIEVFGKKPTLEDVLGEKFWEGPTPYGGMTHQEYLNMVTPKEVQPYAGFSAGQAMVVAATTIAFQWALQNAIRKYHDAKEERAKEAARKEVLDALAALEKARRDAGLPDR
ncbi:MAG TPA: hypothetical protein VFK20_05990 [Vicinamibacterales bacterium]|nr:hypothetical protein [Vicinamibacterales bacterium]